MLIMHNLLAALQLILSGLVTTQRTKYLGRGSDDDRLFDLLYEVSEAKYSLRDEKMTIGEGWEECFWNKQCPCARGDDHGSCS